MKEHKEIFENLKQVKSLLEVQMSGLNSIIQGNSELINSKYPNLMDDLKKAIEKNDFKKIMEIQKDLQNAD